MCISHKLLKLNKESLVKTFLSGIYDTNYTVFDQFEQNLAHTNYITASKRSKTDYNHTGFPYNIMLNFI